MITSPIITERSRRYIDIINLPLDQYREKINLEINLGRLSVIGSYILVLAEQVQHNSDLLAKYRILTERKARIKTDLTNIEIISTVQYIQDNANR